MHLENLTLAMLRLQIQSNQNQMAIYSIDDKGNSREEHLQNQGKGQGFGWMLNIGVPSSVSKDV